MYPRTICPVSQLAFVFDCCWPCLPCRCTLTSLFYPTSSYSSFALFSLNGIISVGGYATASLGSKVVLIDHFKSIVYDVVYSKS